jgi:hypothetical protein
MPTTVDYPPTQSFPIELRLVIKVTDKNRARATSLYSSFFITNEDS